MTVIPISALAGENVVEPSRLMPWYSGPTLLDHLETVEVAEAGEVPARFPVQYVIRPQRAEHRDYRGYAGTVAAGTLRTGDTVVVLPSGITTTVASIDTADGPIDEAAQGRAVTVVLTDDVDVSRGDVITASSATPVATQRVDRGAGLARRHRTVGTTEHLPAQAHDPIGAGDRHRRASSHRHRAARRRRVRPRRLTLNEVGVVTLRTTEPIFVDDYRHSRATGSFVLIDEMTNQTVAAGMVQLETA